MTEPTKLEEALDAHEDVAIRMALSPGTVPAVALESARAEVLAVVAELAEALRGARECLTIAHGYAVADGSVVAACTFERQARKIDLTLALVPGEEG